MKPHPTPEALAQRRGIAVVTGAFFIWGLFPLYFKPLAGVPALELVSHRIVWSAVFVVAWLLWRRELPEVVTVLRDWRKARWLAASAVLICVNWLVYVWAVTHGRVVEVSLGYFINPLFNVALGIAVFRERLSRPQWLAVSLAVAGVLYLSIASGRAPWIALWLAATFAGYGLVRKAAPVGAVIGLAVETLLVAPLAAGWLLWLAINGTASLGAGAWHVDALLVASGIVTALPLAMFAGGARVIPFSLSGVIQYLAPTMVFLLGVLAFGEAFTLNQAVGFALIWASVAVYVGDSLLNGARRK
ncbi:MAG: EamA family transporter RarD, partial [Gammaproteobacteria bacterium]|nr:EamA family transporter RarD [Gammaproteobacteria bacterium]